MEPSRQQDLAKSSQMEVLVVGWMWRGRERGVSQERFWEGCFGGEEVRGMEVRGREMEARNVDVLFVFGSEEEEEGRERSVMEETSMETSPSVSIPHRPMDFQTPRNHPSSSSSSSS